MWKPIYFMFSNISFESISHWSYLFSIFVQKSSHKFYWEREHNGGVSLSSNGGQRLQIPKGWRQVKNTYNKDDMYISLVNIRGPQFCEA